MYIFYRLRILLISSSLSTKLFGQFVLISLAVLAVELSVILISFFVKVVDFANVTVRSKPELDILYDLSSIFLSFFTVVALLIAWNQLRATERTSQSQTYIQIFDSLTKNFESIENIAVKFIELYLYTKKNYDTSLTEGEFVCNFIDRLERNDPDKRIVLEFLTQLENISLLVRRGYISMDDIYFAMKGLLLDASRLFGVYIQREKDRSESENTDFDDESALWEHAHWLLVTIKDYSPRNLLPRTEGKLGK